MKKLTLLIAIILFTVSGIAQEKNKWHESRFERAKIFAEIATQEFDLTKDQQQVLYKKKVQHFEEQFEANKKFKKGEITEDEKKAPNQKFGKYFNKLTGKKYAELKPFYKKVQEAISKIK